MTTPDVLIIGSGIIGSACARTLAADGLSVTVVDPGPVRGAATGASAGMLAPLVEASEDDPVLALKIRGRDHCSDLVPQLEEESGIAVGFWSAGVLHVAFSEDEATELRHRVTWQRQQGFAAEWLSPDEVREIAPGVSDDIIGGSMAPEDGALDPVAFRQALLASAVAAGARIRRRERVTHIDIRDGVVTGVRTNRAAKRGIRCGAVVVAAGCWSGRLHGLPRPLPVEPVRGQMASAPWPAGEPPSIVYGGDVYTLYRHDKAIVGSTMEHVGFSTATTKFAIDGLLDSAGRVFPALRKAPLTMKWAGLRPVTPDGNPLVGRDPDVPNLYYATGHGRAGIVLGSLTGELVRDIVIGNEIEYDLSPLDPQRFWQSSRSTS